MNAAELHLTYRPDNEWDGELDAVVTSGAFSGRGSAWFGLQELKETFVTALRSYPLAASDLPLIEGGFWSKEHPGTLEQCHLRIAVRPYNVRGALLVQVDLATDNDQQQSTTARFITEYAALEVFATNLEQMLDGLRDSATLPGIAK